MKAVVCKQYGPPQQMTVEDVKKPVPSATELLIKVHCASVNSADWHLIRADPFPVRLAFGLFRPKINIFGGDFSGVVEAVGAKTSQFKVGDRVFGDVSDYKLGAYAEYLCAREKDVTHVPDGITMEQAAATPMAAMTAYKGIKEVAKVEPGQKVLVLGATGGVGHFAVQMAKSFGATVTTCAHPEKLEMVKSLGADHVIDTTQQNVVELKDTKFDVIFDVAAFQPATTYLPILADPGIYVFVGGSNKELFNVILKGGRWGSKTQKFVNYLSMANPEHLGAVKELLHDKKIVPYIHKTYPLEGVPQAITDMENRKVQGKLLITVAKE